MIAIFLLSLLQLSVGAVLKHPSSSMLGLDDSLGSLLYELPEYEDPQMLEYELSKLEDHPLVSLIHLARKHAHNKNKHVLSKDAITHFKAQLDSVITRLQTVQERMDKDSSDIPVEDIEKSIQDLKKLENMVKPNIDQLMNVMHPGLSHAESHPIGGGLLNVRSRHPPAIEVTTSETYIYELVPLSTEAPIHEKKPILPKPPPVHELEPPVTKPPVHEIEPPATKLPVYEVKPQATEGPVFALPPPSTEAPKEESEEEEDKEEEEKEERIVPYKDDVFKSGSFQRYEMNPYQDRWQWKTAGFVR